MTIEELYELIKSDESYRIERTVSPGNMDKFQEAICAFANDLPGSRKQIFDNLQPILQRSCNDLATYLATMGRQAFEGSHAPLIRENDNIK